MGLFFSPVDLHPFLIALGSENKAGIAVEYLGFGKSADAPGQLLLIICPRLIVAAKKENKRIHPAALIAFDGIKDAIGKGPSLLAFKDLCAKDLFGMEVKKGADESDQSAKENLHERSPQGG
jgi:hypothetical protein